MIQRTGSFISSELIVRPSVAGRLKWGMGSPIFRADELSFISTIMKEEKEEKEEQEAKEI